LEESREEKEIQGYRITNILVIELTSFGNEIGFQPSLACSTNGSSGVEVRGVRTGPEKQVMHRTCIEFYHKLDRSAKILASCPGIWPVLSTVAKNLESVAVSRNGMASKLQLGTCALDLVSCCTTVTEVTNLAILVA
jgi:hypothetical protein